MIEKKLIESYKDYGRVISISNGTVEAYVTVDVGPRIIRYGFVGGQNIMNDQRKEFKPEIDDEYQAFFGKGKMFENFGGHRIWTSPEAYPATYYPDCTPVAYELTDAGAVFTADPEVENGIQKQLEVRMTDTDMEVIMRVKNIGDKTQKFSVWGLSVSAQDGVVIIPMNDNDTKLLSNRIISVWPYTDMSDDRIYWGKKYVTVKQDRNALQPMKLGFDLNCGTVYYVLGEDTFCKKYATYHPTAEYPDGGCSFETYSCALFTEVESLGALKEIAPGETNEHTEHWTLTKTPVKADFRNDAAIADLLSKL